MATNTTKLFSLLPPFKGGSGRVLRAGALLLLLLLTICPVQAADNLFSAATTTMSCWSMPGWQGKANTTFASWQNDTLVVNVPGNCGEQWQCQVKLHTQGIVLSADHHYVFRCRMHTARAISMVTIKLFDDNPLSMGSQYSLSAGDNAVQTPAFQGGSVGNGVIVFDFGFAQQGDVITVTDIRLEQSDADTPDHPGNPDDEGYVLVWNEEFTDGALDRNAWNIEVNGDGGGNNELQYYCEKGVSIERDPVEGKQCLVLTARKENYMGKTCTSGRVTTQDRTTFLHGKVEARIWFPLTANGLWPAFWMMGNDISSVGWPACGETDIVELGHSNGFNGTQDRYFNGASHWGPSWDKHYQYANSITNDYSVEDGFHIWTCIWDEEKVEMYVDRDARPSAAPYYRMSIPQSSDMADTNPGKYFHKPNFLLLNLAIGGNFPGIWNIDQITALQSGEKKMYIDWVRIYQPENAINLQALSPSDEIEGGTPSEEAVRDTTTPAPTVRKQIQNGKILIIRGNTKYDVLGNINQ